MITMGRLERLPLTEEEKKEFIRLTQELTKKLEELHELQIKALKAMADLETKIPDLMTEIETIYYRLSKVLTRMEAYWDEKEEEILREIYGDNPPKLPDA